jgi:AraC-like DNA-binding protein
MGALQLNLTPVDRVLRRTPLLAAGEYRCPVTHPQFAGGGPQLCHYIVFPRRAVRIQVEGDEPQVAAPGTLRFYNVGDCYGRAAIGRQADESDWIGLDARLFEELLVHLPGARADTVSSARFALRASPASARLCLAQRRLFAWVEAEGVDRLGFEEDALELTRSSLEEAALAWCADTRRRRTPRPASQRRRRQIAEQAKEILALDPALELSLGEVAHQVHCSVAHLSRVFRRHTGATLHGYRQQIRLHQALQMLGDGGLSLADVAAQLGFASQSHMSEAFRRHFGARPSGLRALAAGRPDRPGGAP